MLVSRYDMNRDELEAHNSLKLKVLKKKEIICIIEWNYHSMKNVHHKVISHS